MKIKTSELTGAALDWAVAKCEGRPAQYLKGFVYEVDHRNGRVARYSTDWCKGGPIIEREKLDLTFDAYWIRDLLDPEDNGDRWYATPAGQDEHGFYSPTPLIAAMRCYVASKLGDEVEVPDELSTGQSQ